MDHDLHDCFTGAGRITAHSAAIDADIGYVYFAQFEQGQVSLGMAMAVVSVGMTVLLLPLVEAMNSKRKWNAS